MLIDAGAAWLRIVGLFFSGGGNRQEGVFDISVWGYRRRRGGNKDGGGHRGVREKLDPGLVSSRCVTGAQVDLFL